MGIKKGRMALQDLPSSIQKTSQHMNGNPFPVRSCVPVSTADHFETPVREGDFTEAKSSNWADDLLLDIPAYLIIGHLSRLRGARWNEAGILNVKRAK